MQSALDPEVGQTHPHTVLGQVEQPPADFVHQCEPQLRVEGDHALRDPVQHRLAMLGEPGDLAWFQTESLAFGTPGQQP